jgi:hypothetical protein
VDQVEVPRIQLWLGRLNWLGRERPNQGEAVADLSRRKLLKDGSLGLIAGVAAISGVDKVASIPGLVADANPDLSSVGSDVVAHVRNASTGEVAVMVGTSEVVYRDPQLVGRLLAAARRASQEG